MDARVQSALDRLPGPTLLAGDLNEQEDGQAWQLFGQRMRVGGDDFGAATLTSISSYETATGSSRGDIDGVEQLTRYLELMNRDPALRPVTGVFAAQVIKPQARTLAEDRGIRCVTLDYDAMRGVDDAESRLF